MNTKPVSPSRLAAILAAYGADPARWPAEERDAALQLRTTLSSAEQQRFAEEAKLDAHLRENEKPVGSASPALRARVNALPYARRQSSAAETQANAGFGAWTLRLLGIGFDEFWTPRAFAPAAAMLAVVALIGFTAGYRGLVAPPIDGLANSAELLSLEDETLLPLSEDWS